MTHAGAQMDRRSFITGAAMTAAGATIVSAGTSTALAAESPSAAKDSAAHDATPSFMTPPDPIADADITETITADVVIVGAGTAGLCCALSAAERGLKVVVFAQSPNVVARGGSNAVVYSTIMNEYGLPRIDERFLLAQMAQASFNIDVAKWHKWYNNSEESINWLIDRTSQVEGIRITIEQSNVWPDDMRTYPLFGPEESHCWNNDDFPVVADGQPSLVFALRKLCEEQGVTFYFNTHAEQLVRGGVPNGTTGRVDAVIGSDADGNYVKFVGTTGIVLATGDFSGNREMMERYAPEAVDWVTNWDEAQTPDTLGKVYGGLYKGRGQQMGLWVGAAWQRTIPNAAMAATFAAPCSQPWNAPDTIMVNDAGKRFCCEDMGVGHLPYVIKHEGPINAVFDAEYPSHHMPWHNWKNVYGEGDMTADEVLASWDAKVEAGSMFKADTLEDLASQMGVDADAMIASIERYNELCDAGVDEDFHKRPELLVPVRTAPFYGYRKDAPKFLTILGGLRTNINMQVCEDDDTPIEGLFNIGTMVGDAFANSYNFLVEGHNLGMNCITFGYLTGKYLAGGWSGIAADPDYVPPASLGIQRHQDDSAKAKQSDEDLDGAAFADGTYTGYGYGIVGEIDVTIQVKDGHIAVSDISPNNETKGIGGYEAIEDGTYAKQVEEAQSYKLDGVAGATVTSNAIKMAVKRALEQAVKA